jgi:tetratricopeptide (TPR) repeat protein
VYSVCFSADGRTLASGSRDGTVRLWEVASGKELTRLTGHTGSVESVCFSADGRTLVSASMDKTIRLWDVSVHQSGRPTWSTAARDYAAFTAAFDVEKADLSLPPLTRTNLCTGVAGSLHVLPAGSHLPLLVSKGTREQIALALATHYLRCGNIDAALLLFPNAAPGADRDRLRVGLFSALLEAAGHLIDAGSLFLPEQRLQQAAALQAKHPLSTYLLARLEMARLSKMTSAERPRSATPKALDLLQQAVREGFTDWQRLEQDPVFRPLQSDRRFTAVVESLIPPEEWIRRARLIRLKSPQQAIALCERALAKNPNYPWAYSARASANARLGNTAAAVADYQRALLLRPADPSSYYNLACGYSLRAGAHPATPEGQAVRQADLDLALFYLEDAKRKGWTNWAHARKDEDLKPLFNHPRFLKLLPSPLPVSR